MHEHFVECIRRDEKPHCDPGMTETAAQKRMLPVVLKCVETWKIDGVENPTPATFPGTPKKDASRLMGWLIDRITEIYVGEELNKPAPNA